MRITQLFTCIVSEPVGALTDIFLIQVLYLGFLFFVLLFLLIQVEAVIWEIKSRFETALLALQLSAPLNLYSLFVFHRTDNEFFWGSPALWAFHPRVFRFIEVLLCGTPELNHDLHGNPEGSHFIVSI